MAVGYLQCFADIVLVLDTIVSDACDRVVVIIACSIMLARKQRLFIQVQAVVRSWLRIRFAAHINHIPGK
jgi:hypothetical protein